MSKIYLNVAYADKDEAKSAGAKWDANARQWYWWQDADRPLPEALVKFAPAGGAKSEAEIKAEISKILMAVRAGIPVAIAAARQIIRDNAGKSPDPYDACGYVLGMSDAALGEASLDNLSALIATDRQNLDRFLAGKSSDPIKAIMSVFADGGETAKDRLAKIQGATADILVRETMREIAADYSRKCRIEGVNLAKRAALAETEVLLAKIDPLAIDLDNGATIDNHDIRLGFYNLDAARIVEIDGDAAVRLADGTFCAWLDRMPAVQKINKILTERYRAEMMAKAATFEPKSIDIEKEKIIVHARDGRTAEGYMDGSEFVIHTIGQHSVSSFLPAVQRIAAAGKLLMGVH